MEIIRRISFNKEVSYNTENLLTKEWLVTNGLGGYASGTIGGVPTRRYHALLISALQAPLGRRVMINHLQERLVLANGTEVHFGSEERPEQGLIIPIVAYLKEFRLENGLPFWRFEAEGIVLEKSILLPHGQNTVHVTYKLLSGDGPVKLYLRPSIHFRPHESPVSEELLQYKMSIVHNNYEISSNDNLPPLRLKLYGQNSSMTSEGDFTREIIYRTEESRGYEFKGLLWNPGYFRAFLTKGQNATFIASTENWDTILALNPEDAYDAEMIRRRQLIEAAHPCARSGPSGELVLAADQFIFTPAGRIEDAIRVQASGNRLKSIIAGYHWFTDWGRDTMISLEGLTLNTGRIREAHWILKTFAHYIKDGLLPNLFPEGEKEGLYHTADATLWFFHAVERYVKITDDKAIIRYLMPKLKEIIEHHLKGTHFNIKVDPEDGLLHQGAEGYQLTWMDAKVADWVVTPRRGKAVEINALWYNALCIFRNWLAGEEGEEAAKVYDEQIRLTYNSFNDKFWYEEGGYLYDVIEGEDGNDNALRPNQIFSFSLLYPVLKEERWESVLNIVKDKLLTPVGLRSLAEGHPDFKSKYFGDLRSRDAAYHQGTVWGWLIGPFIDAWLKVHPDGFDEAESFLEGFNAHLDEACIGSISEVFDAESPYTPRGCIAQAWSVAEVLRCRIKLAMEKEKAEMSVANK